MITVGQLTAALDAAGATLTMETTGDGRGRVVWQQRVGGATQISSFEAQSIGDALDDLILAGPIRQHLRNPPPEETPPMVKPPFDITRPHELRTVWNAAWGVVTAQGEPYFHARVAALQKQCAVALDRYRERGGSR